jgi:RNA polymerase sigma-70 factor (TIGR02960 family)
MSPVPAPSPSIVEAAIAGDDAAFEQAVAPHRRELHVHCYRMLASYDDAEDAVQETLVRAWRRRGDLDGPDLFRAWLYRIATNVCLDQLRSRTRRAAAIESHADLPWLQPYPDRHLDEVAADRETIELSFVVALQVLPPRQRAVFVARDLLGWTAAETADALDTTVPAANSALQRARATLSTRLSPRRGDWSTPTDLSDEERDVLARFIDAHERLDVDAALALAGTDITITMPPAPMVFRGRAGLAPLLERAFGPQRDGDWRLIATSANRQPAAASYLRRPGDTVFRGFKLDVLDVREGEIVAITTFGYSRFEGLGLPLELRGPP